MSWCKEDILKYVYKALQNDFLVAVLLDWRIKLSRDINGTWHVPNPNYVTHSCSLYIQYISMSFTGLVLIDSCLI
jgi:hypothetical protein